MHPLRSVFILSLAVTAMLCAFCAAQATQQAPPASATPAAPPSDARLQNLPPFLLIVPGGTVQMGLTADDLVRVACEAVYPDKPASAVKIAATKLEVALKRTARTLGQRRVHVDTFMLGKWTVKNSEFEVFVKQMRAQGKRMRPPFHWWRYGCKDDYDKRLPDISRQFPKDEDGAIKFWEANGHELPFQLLDDDGKSIADLPVAFVTYPDAVAFAGWLGMRLATEAEWTRAARGDGTHIWPWGNTALGDTFKGDPMLKAMRLYATKDKKPLPTGTVESATGPYGHVDMFGRIWQYVTTTGFAPINGTEPFSEQWKLLLKDKVGAMLQSAPGWDDRLILVKGGSYLSGSEPVQLLLDARLSMEKDQVPEGAGLRLAKSLNPGSDMLYSMVRTAYNRAAFAPEQDIDMASQAGAERYELAADGFPSAYHAVSLALVNWLSSEKGADLGKLLDRSQQTALLIGTLALTEPLLNPAVPAGLYSVLYRDEGMTKELTEAIKVGFKEVQAALKLKEKAAKNGGEAKPDEANADEADKKKADWIAVLERYGLLPADLEPKEAAKGLEFVRIDGIVVSTKHACFLLLGNEGKVLVAIPAVKDRPGSGRVPSTLALVADANGKTTANFHFSVPIQAQDLKKVAEFQLSLTVDCAPPTPAVPWRLPVSAAAVPARPAAAAPKDTAKDKEAGEPGAGGTNGNTKSRPK